MADDSLRRTVRFTIGAIALGWLAALAGLAFFAANPVVVNRTQLLHCDAIVQGRWDPQQPTVFRVEKSWKRDLSGQGITLEGPGTQQQRQAVLVIPITQVSESAYRITQGPLVNLPRDPLVDPVPAMVQPLVYPAIPAVLAQLESHLETATQPIPDTTMPGGQPAPPESRSEPQSEPQPRPRPNLPFDVESTPGTATDQPSGDGARSSPP